MKWINIMEYVRNIITRLIKVIPSWKILHLDVPQVPCLGVDGGLGELVLEGLEVLGAGHTIFHLSEHSDEAVTVRQITRPVTQKQGHIRNIALTSLPTMFTLCVKL